MSAIKNVIILGAGGNLGPTILHAFLNNKSFVTTVLSREGSKSTFPPGVKVLHADYNSVDSLKNAFHGQDAVISLVAGHALGDQNKLIDAAIAAGVKRFVPSEFGSNTADAKVRSIVPAFEAKYGTVNYLKSKESEISWSSFITGPFFDWGVRSGFLGFSSADKTAIIFDNGTATFTSTNLRSIGLAIIKAFENPDLSKNKYIYISGVQTTQNQILAAAEKATGEKWTVVNVSAKDTIEKGRAKLQKGDFSGIGDLIQGVTFDAEHQYGDLSSAGLWNGKLGLENDDVERSVKVALEGKLVHEV